MKIIWTNVERRKISFTKLKWGRRKRRKKKLWDDSSEEVVEGDYICHTGHSAFISRARQSRANLLFIQYTPRLSLRKMKKPFFLLVSFSFIFFYHAQEKKERTRSGKAIFHLQCVKSRDLETHIFSSFVCVASIVFSALTERVWERHSLISNKLEEKTFLSSRKFIFNLKDIESVQPELRLMRSRLEVFFEGVFCTWRSWWDLCFTTSRTSFTFCFHYKHIIDKLKRSLDLNNE